MQKLIVNGTFRFVCDGGNASEFKAKCQRLLATLSHSTRILPSGVVLHFSFEPDTKEFVLNGGKETPERTDYVVSDKPKPWDPDFKPKRFKNFTPDEPKTNDEQNNPV